MADNQGEVTIRIISVDTDTDVEKKGGGTYPGAEITYKTTDGKTLTKGIHKNQFKYNGQLLEDLNSLSKGDYVRVTYKKEGDFTNWTAVEKVDRPAEKEEVADKPAAASAKPSASRETYNDPRESKEERATRQSLIVRQSSLSNALEFYSLLQKAGSKHAPDIDEIKEVADEFYSYVFGVDPPVINEQPDDGFGPDPD